MDKYTHLHLADVQRIQFVLKKYRYNLGLIDCAEIWQKYSDFRGSEWFELPDSEPYLVDICKFYM